MQLFIPLLIGALLVFLFSKLAKRKNRSGIVWGLLVGGSFTTLLFMAIAIPSFVSPETGRTTSFIVGALVYGLLALFICSAILLSFLPPICSTCKKKLSRQEWKCSKAALVIETTNIPETIIN